MKSLTRRSTVSLPGRKLHRIRYAVSDSRGSGLAGGFFPEGIGRPPASITPASTAAWRCWLGRTPSRPAGSSNVPLTRPPQTHPPLPPATLHKGRSAGGRPHALPGGADEAAGQPVPNGGRGGS